MAEIYFSHDANAADDEKIQSLLYARGASGYGLYWIMVERMRRAEKDRYRLALKPYVYTAIARIGGVDPEEVRQFIKECCETHELFVCDGEWVWSESLLRRMELKDAKKEQAREAVQKRWKKNGRRTNNDQTDTREDQQNTKRTTDEYDRNTDVQDEYNGSTTDRYKDKDKDKEKDKREILENSLESSGDPGGPPDAHGGKSEKKRKSKTDLEPVGELYHRIKEAYESQWDNKTLPDYAREGPAIKKLVSEAESRGRDAPVEWAKRFVNTHWRLKRDTESLLHGHPFLPSIGVSSGLKPRILEAMQAPAQAVTQLSDRDRRKLAELGVEP